MDTEHKQPLFVTHNSPLFATVVFHLLGVLAMCHQDTVITKHET